MPRSKSRQKKQGKDERKKLAARKAKMHRDLDKVLERNDTSEISPLTGYWVANQIAKKIAEEEGRVYECYVRECPRKHDGSGDYKTDAIFAFIRELNDIKGDIPDGETRRIQLALNFDGQHWSGVDFAVTNKGISILALDAVQYPTLESEIKAFNQALGEDNVKIAYNDDLPIQRYFTCFVKTMEMLRRASNEAELHRLVDERCTKDADFARGLDYFARDNPKIDWIQMTVAIAQLTENINPGQFRDAYEKYNPEVTRKLCDSTDETMWEKLFDPGTMVGPHPSPNKNEDVSYYPRRILEAWVAMTKPTIDAIESTDQLDYRHKMPLSQDDYLKEKTRVEALHEDKVQEALDTLTSDASSNKERAAAHEFLDRVERCKLRPHGEEIWGGKAVKLTAIRAFDRVYEDIHDLLPYGRGHGCDGAILYGHVMEAVLNKIEGNPDFAGVYQQANMDMLRQKIAEGRKDYDIDFAADPGLKAHLDQLVRQTVDVAFDIDNAGGNKVKHQEIVKDFVGFVENQFEQNHLVAASEVKARQVFQQLAANAKAGQGGLKKVESAQFLVAVGKLQAKAHELIQQAQLAGVDDPFLKKCEALIGQSGNDRRQFYDKLIAMVNDNSLDPPSPTLQEVRDIVQGETIKLGQEKRILEALIPLVTDKVSELQAQQQAKAAGSADVKEKDKEKILRSSSDPYAANAAAVAAAAGSAQKHGDLPFSADNRTSAAAAAGQPLGRDLTASSDSISSRSSGSSANTAKFDYTSDSERSDSERSGSFDFDEDKKSKSFASSGFGMFAGGAIGASRGKAAKAEAKKEQNEQSGGPSLNRSTGSNED